MPFAITTGWLFRDSILQKTPKVSGVYGLFRPNVWIYVGESADIQARLVEHLKAPAPCIARQKPTGFTYESCSADQRVARQNGLILELNPVCNQKLG